MSSRFRRLPSYRYFDSADGIIENPASYNLRDYTITGNRGKNIVPHPYAAFSGAKTVSRNGVVFTDNGDSTITVNGTSTGPIWFWLSYNILPEMDVTKTYIFSGGVDNGCYLSMEFYNDSTLITHTSTANSNQGSAVVDLSAISKTYNKAYFGYILMAGKILDNLVLKPQLELGKTATEFEPYKGVGDYDETSNKYIIPVKNGTEITNIYLDAPLTPGKSINKINDNLPNIKLHSGKNTLTADTSISPASVNWQYYKY